MVELSIMASLKLIETAKDIVEYDEHWGKISEKESR